MSAASASDGVPRMFVSHSHRDDDYCRAFVHELRTAGVDVWYDEHNLTSGQLLTDIQRELHARRIFVPILSKAALNESTWVKNECMWAFSLYSREPRRTFLPVTGAPIEQSDFGADWLFLEGFKRIEAPKLLPYPPQEAARRVLSAIGHVMPRVEVATPVLAATASAPVPTAPASAPVSAAPRTFPVAPPRRPATARPPVIAPDRFPQCLGKLGFTAHVRDGVEYIVPPLCPVPAGPFLMGSDKRRDPQTQDWEQPQHTVTLPAYQIARYPVTIAEYACFVHAGQKEPPQGFLGVDWRTQLRRVDHPVTHVSWHDAAAYAAWLAQLTGQPWRLPTEAEWEKAARGTDGRLYPWGNSFDSGRCNTYESGIGTTTPLGAYPSDASLCGAQDMAGNVWEWTSSLFTPYPYRLNDGREEPNPTENRVLRGGSWYVDSGFARCACRNNLLPDTPYDNVGFRLVFAASGT